MITRMLTAQEIFDKSYLGIVNQGELSFTQDDGETNCQYRTLSLDDKPLMCAAGHLILDTCYSKSLEKLSADTASVKRALTNSGVSTEHHSLVGGIAKCPRQFNPRPPCPAKHAN